MQNYMFLVYVSRRAHARGGGWRQTDTERERQTGSQRERERGGKKKR